MAGTNYFSDIKVKIGSKVTVNLEASSDWDKFYLLLNQQVFQFTADATSISIGDYLIEGNNHVVCKVDNIGGGPFGEPSKWKAGFSIKVDETIVLSPYTDEGDDWWTRKEHVVLDGKIIAEF